MKLKNILSPFLLLVFLVTQSPIAFAQETDDEDGDYLEVEAKQTVPYDGYLFDGKGLAKMIAKCDARIKLAVLEKETELGRKIIELDTEVKKKDKEIEIKKDMYEGMLKVRQDRIDQLVSDAKWNKLFIAGSFVGGIVLTVGVVYLAGQVLR